MHSRSATSNDSFERTRFLERVAERSGSGLLIALGALELGVAVTFLAGGAITRYHLLPFAVVLLATWLYRDGTAANSDRRVGASSFGVSLLVVFASFVLAGSTLDLSPDGQSAHMLRISHLANGWNPVYDAEFIDQPAGYILAGAETRSVDSGLGPYMVAASAVALLGDIEYGKGFNLILMGAVALLALVAVLGARVRPGIAVVVALTAALNPVSVVQSLTTYVDGQIAALIACLVFLTMILARRSSMWTTTAWVAALALLVNAKVTGIAFALIIGSGALVFLLWRGFSPRRGVASFFVGLTLGISVIGFNGSVLEFVRRARILVSRDLGLAANFRLLVATVALAMLGVAAYWLLHRLDGPGHVRSLARPRVVALGLGTALIVSLLLIGGLSGEVPSFMRFATIVESDDAGLLVQPSGKIAQALGSIFSESAVMPATYDNDTGPTGYRIKIPFQVRSDELSSYRHLNPDHRVGGFGPWMSGAFLVGLSVLLLMWLQGSEARYELGFWLAVILATVLLFPKLWWARFVPQTWLVPVLVAADGCRPTNRRVTRRLAQVLLVIVSVNAGMVLYEHGRGQIALQSAIHRTMLALRGLPQPVPVYFSSFRSTVFRFRDYGVAYVDTPASECLRYLTMPRSPIRVCAESPEEPGWQEALAQAQAIDADLAGAGIESFRVVPPDPRDRIALLEPQVQSLVEKGALLPEQARELVRSLRRTGRLVERSEDGSALESLSAFSQSILSLMDSGSLHPEVALPLLESASGTGLPLDNPFAGFSISIDVDDLSYGGFSVDGAAGFAGSTDPVPLVLMAGSHTLTLKTGRTLEPGFDFTVEADGTLQFDPSLDTLVEGRGTKAIVLRGVTGISIDASQLSYSTAELTGAGDFNEATDSVPFVLMPGNHRLTILGGRSPRLGFDFTVEANGTIQFDPSLDSLVGGRGTQTMVLHGTRIDIDASELSYSRLDLIGASDYIETTDPARFVLMPGDYRLGIPTGGSPAPGFDFTVEADGTLQFDPALDPLVGGRGTKAMALHGTRVAIDVSELSYISWDLGGGGDLNVTTDPIPLLLMPGGHRLVAASGRGLEFAFTVEADGTLQFCPSLDSLVGGRGTRALVLHGTRIDIDISKLSRSGYVVGTADNLKMMGSVPFVFMPGGHILALQSDRSPQPTVDFTVHADGTLRFDPSLDPLVDGRGTRAMVLHGTRIDIDISELSYLKFDLLGAVGFTEPLDPVSFILMPGGHGLTMPTSGTPGPGLDFTVETDGTLQFDPSLDPLVGGRGTWAIVLHGMRIDIDVSELSYSRFNLAGAGRFIGAPDPMPFVLMPGGHGLTMRTSSGPEPRLDFKLQADGTLWFDPSLDPLVSGRGTRAMVLHGTPIDIDARGSTAPSVDGLAAFPAQQILAANLMPGAHRFRSSEVDFAFEVTPDLTINYDAALDGYVFGRGTTALLVNVGLLRHVPSHQQATMTPRWQ